MTRRLLPRSLRARLFAGLAGTLIVSLVVTLAVGALLTRRSLEQEAQRSLARQIDLIAAQRNQQGAEQRGVPDLGRFLATEQERLAILTPAQAQLLLPERAARAIHGPRAVTGSLELHGVRYLYAARGNGSEALVLLRSARKQSAEWTPFLTGLAVAAGIGAVLAALASFALARAIARPVRRVANASLRLAAGQQPPVLRPEGADEMAALASSFNHLSNALAHSQDGERAFLLSVSHELKTPLTAIRGHAEALVDGVLVEQQVGRVIEREASRLERLICDLLDLARLRRRSFAVRREEVDLGDAAREAVTRYLPLARRFGVELTAGVERDARAAGDVDRVLQAISNLVENALRCTPHGGAVRVLASPCRVDVVDDGPGLDADDLEHAFERFYLDERHGADRPVGTGLGLAIVHELAHAMGGAVEVRSTPGVGSIFSLLLPPAGIGAGGTALHDQAGLASP